MKDNRLWNPRQSESYPTEDTSSGTAVDHVPIELNDDRNGKVAIPHTVVESIQSYTHIPASESNEEQTLTHNNNEEEEEEERDINTNTSTTSSSSSGFYLPTPFFYNEDTKSPVIKEEEPFTVTINTSSSGDSSIKINVKKDVEKELLITHGTTEGGEPISAQVVTHTLRYQILGALGALAYFMSCSTLLLFVMNFVHARMPRIDPLPDIGHDLIRKLEPEYLGDIVLGILFFLLVCSLVVSREKRWKIITRFLFAYGTLYLIRTTTIFATSLPATENHCYYNYQPITNIWWNTFLGLISFGALNKHCGDLLFSGHTMSITLITLVFWCYFTRQYLFNLIVTILAVAGYFFIIATRSHYTVDVLVALYLTILIWRTCPENWDKILYYIGEWKKSVKPYIRRLFCCRNDSLPLEDVSSKC
jgi:hypothetical protein